MRRVSLSTVRKDEMANVSARPLGPMANVTCPAAAACLTDTAGSNSSRETTAASARNAAETKGVRTCGVKRSVTHTVRHTIGFVAHPHRRRTVRHRSRSLRLKIPRTVSVLPVLQPATHALRDELTTILLRGR